MICEHGEATTDDCKKCDERINRKCNHGEFELCKNCCAWDHYDDEKDCIICSHDDKGGNWRRWLMCFFYGHDWDYTYSWIGHCQTCQRLRLRKDY